MADRVGAPQAKNSSIDSHEVESTILSLAESSRSPIDQHLDQASKLLLPALANEDAEFAAFTAATHVQTPSEASSSKPVQVTPIRQSKRWKEQKPKTAGKPEKNVKKIRTEFSFNEEFRCQVDIPPDVLEVEENENDELSYFYKFFPSYLFIKIAEASTQYAIQTMGPSFTITENDVKNFIAIELMMGIIKLPAYSDYWKQETRIHYIADVMSLKDYQKIRQFLHFADNSLNDGDRYYEIRPILDEVRNNCINLENENNQSIDEMMVPYKGTKAGSRKQYMPKKSTKWGMKMFVRAGASGIVYDFIIYGGADTFRQHKFTKRENRFDFAQKIVIALCQTMPNKALKAIHFDNFFCNLELIHYLRNRYGILSLGTIQSNRLRGLNFEPSTKKTKRGSCVEKADNEKKVVVVRWYDNKDVILASSFLGKEPEVTVMRYDKKARKKVAVPCPSLIQKYNQHMGGVDKVNMLVALYRTKYRTHKWYMAIFSQLLDVSVANGWLFKKRQQTSKQRLKEFRWVVAQSLLKMGQSSAAPCSGTIDQSILIRKPTRPRPPDSIRFDEMGHFPKPGAKERCKLCKNGKSRIHCVKCGIALCLLPERNCFLQFHTK